MFNELLKYHFGSYSLVLQHMSQLTTINDSCLLGDWL